MDIKPLAQVLEDLLYDAGDDGLEICLAEAVSEESPDWEAVQSEYQHRFLRTIDTVAELRGEPHFIGVHGSPEFPAWLEAREVATWSDAAGLIYVALRDGEANIAILGGGRPHPVKREAVTLLPPSD